MSCGQTTSPEEELLPSNNMQFTGKFFGSTDRQLNGKNAFWFIESTKRSIYKMSFKNGCCGATVCPSWLVVADLANSLRIKDFVNDPSGLGSGKSNGPPSPTNSLNWLPEVPAGMTSYASIHT